MKKIEFNQEQVKRIIDMYTKEILGLRPIGKEFGVSNFVIKKVLKENNIQIDTPGQRFKGGKKVADKKWQQKNKEKLSEYYKEWSEKNREHRREYHAKWREKNKETYQEYRRNYEKTKKDNDPTYRLASYTRTAIYTCLKERNINKYKNTFDLLPYGLEDLVQHLEKKFQEGMTWENYGEWHVDHVKPMSSFVFESPEDKEFQECWSLNNLQPLWGNENIKKSNKLLF